MRGGRCRVGVAARAQGCGVGAEQRRGDAQGECAAVGRRLPAYERVGVESVDEGEQLPGDRVGVTGRTRGEAEGALRDSVGDDARDHGLPGIHLLAHGRGERRVAGAERPALHPDERDVVAAAVEHGVDERSDAPRRRRLGAEQRGDVVELVGDDRGEGGGDELVHAVDVVGDETGGDAHAGGDRAQRERGESLLECELAGGALDLSSTLGGRLAGAGCGGC